MAVPGMQVVGGYQLEELIGRGGYGAVYRAYDPPLQRRVAVKLLASDLAEDEAFRSLFLREGRAGAHVEHPNVVTVYAAGADGANLYIAMRWVRGGDLHRQLQDGLTGSQALRLLAQVAAGLDAAHQVGVVHRDIKPANVLVENAAHAFLADFGIARLVEGGNVQSTRGLRGTLAYMAPELLDGHSPAPASDIYSFACTAFECLTGQRAFPATSEGALVRTVLSPQRPVASHRQPALPPAIDTVLNAGMALDPRARPATATRLVEQLAQALSQPARPSRPAKARAAPQPLEGHQTARAVPLPAVKPLPHTGTTIRPRDAQAPSEPASASSTAAVAPQAPVRQPHRLDMQQRTGYRSSAPFPAAKVALLLALLSVVALALFLAGSR